MIVCKGNKKVLACTETEIIIQKRYGSEDQKWLLKNDIIMSSKYNTVMYGRKEDSRAILGKNMAEGNPCYLQLSVSLVLEFKSSFIWQK